MNAIAKQLTIPEFVQRKQTKKKIAMVTAYDYTMASLVDAAGADAILVGDSLAMVVQGHATTLPVTMEEMIYHAKMVGRAVRNALTIVDLPFPINHLNKHDVIAHASRVLKETGCQSVKLEGGADQADVIEALVSAGIPVMAHVGLRPQSIHAMGGYKVQRDAERLHDDALAAQTAGAFGIVLECIPSKIAADLTRELHIPTIGIGAGPDCDGQVLVINDLLGLPSQYVPRFVKQYANLKETISGAVSQYCREVHDGLFPDEAHSFSK
jgi:3-methyl-2-oxobutanoate hydroxymethyltransferase